MADNIFKKYRARIAREGILKAVLLGASIGLAALSVIVFICWFAEFKAGLWIGLGVFAALTAGLSPLFYYKLYRPTTKAIAKRVDELGLEERVLTMVELEGDPSYVAMRQREDTMKALGSVNHMLVKVAVSAALIVTFGVGLVLGTSMATVGSLYAADVIPGGATLVAGEKLPKSYTLSYSVSGSGGSIVMYGDDWENETAVSEKITVTEGEDAPAVLAVEDSEHIFVGWSDGVTEAYRRDLNVKSNLEVSAVFLKYVENYDGPAEPDFQVPDVDHDNDDNDNDDPPDENAPPFPNPPPKRPDESNSGNDNENIEDGNTPYDQNYENDRNQALDELGSDDSMGDDLKGGIDDYFNSLQPGDGSGDGSGGSDGGSGLGG